VAFDDVEVLPVIAVHKVVGQGTGDTGQGERRQKEAMRDGGTQSPLSLGTGETIRNGIYRFATNFSGYNSNDSRPLFAHTAGFNTNRWVLGGPMSERWQESGAWVIYRHKLDGTRDGGREARERRIQFETAVMTFEVGYYESGQLVVEVSNDGKEWKEVGRFSPSGGYTAQVPKELLPADEIWGKGRGAWVYRLSRRR
jgi:hypothetical protein